jgi:hypothetical protein
LAPKKNLGKVSAKTVWHKTVMANGFLGTKKYFGTKKESALPQKRKWTENQVGKFKEPCKTRCVIAEDGRLLPQMSLCVEELTDLFEFYTSCTGF